MRLGIWLVAVYFGLVLMTGWLFWLERKDIKITRWNRIKTMLFHPVYIITYLIAICRIPLIKNKWEVITHHASVQEKQ